MAKQYMQIVALGLKDQRITCVCGSPYAYALIAKNGASGYRAFNIDGQIYPIYVCEFDHYILRELDEDG